MNKLIYNIIIALSLIFATTSCGNDDELTFYAPPARTVLIYACAENSLNSFFSGDYNEMVTGAKNNATTIGDNNLLVFIDRADSSNPPYIVKITASGAKTVYTFDSDFICTDPGKMKEVFNWVISNYPADSYGLCFWGHGDGVICHTDTVTNTFTSRSTAITSSSAMKRAYGFDSGNNSTDDTGKGINIPSLANAIAESFSHLDFIFWDCCNMQNFESDYELRNVCDYIVGSPAEIPGAGAPYDYVIPDLFLAKDKVGQAIVDDYTNHGLIISTNYYTGSPLSAVKTSALDNLAQETMTALRSVYDAKNSTENISQLNVSLSNCVYYFTIMSGFRYPIMYDIKSVMKHNLTDTQYNTWNSALNKAVVYARHPADISTTGVSDWTTNKSINFNSFTLDDDNYGGMSMFFPSDVYINTASSVVKPNEAIFKYQISSIINWHEFGW